LIAQESIEALKTQLDIVDVVGNYIELRKMGGNYKAPCPFHDEKTPSFVVSPQKQIYHCFGCGAGGDALKFVMEFEHLSYPEAIEKLASQYNFTLRYTSTQKKQDSTILEELNNYYQKLLPNHKIAMGYLLERGVQTQSIERFELGYAPSSNETLQFLKTHFFSLQEAAKLGAIGYDGNNSYARFIQRITFPIHSQSGKIVGFGGRTITGHQAKYINSPETPLFNKSRLLYGYHLARGAIFKKKEILISEGYLDVIMLHQAGFDNAVATLGTALTKEHIPLLKKGDVRVIVAYDGDNAGVQAALKASKLLSASGFDGGVVLFENGFDPADMVQKGLTDKLSQIFRKPVAFIEFVLAMILDSYNLSDPKQKEKALAEIKQYLSTLSPLLQEEYSGYVASKMQIPQSLVKLRGENQKSQPSQERSYQQKYKDIWELTLIKTIIEHPEYIKNLLDIINPSFLEFHRQEFELVLQEQTSHPMILDIVLDEGIKPLTNYEELQQELLLFLVRYYERGLKRVQSSKKISFEKKAYYIRKYRDTITRLKNGELVQLPQKG